MNPTIKRAGRIAACLCLAGAPGCSQSTEVTLAKVPPVTITPQAPTKSNIPSIHSPDVLPNH